MARWPLKGGLKWTPRSKTPRKFSAAGCGVAPPEFAADGHSNGWISAATRPQGSSSHERERGVAPPEGADGHQPSIIVIPSATSQYSRWRDGGNTGTWHNELRFILILSLLNFNYTTLHSTTPASS